MLTVLFGTATLGVDFGRAVLQKARLQEAADAAAVAVAHAMQEGERSEQRKVGRRIINQNLKAGDAKKNTGRTIKFGLWDKDAREFRTRNPGDPKANAVQITLTGKTQSYFASAFLGKEWTEYHITSVGMIVHEVETDLVIPSTANPWLAGMPDGTYANYERTGASRDWAEQFMGWTVRRDVAGSESPLQVTALDITPGESIEFDSIAGEMNLGRFNTNVELGGHRNYGADGDPDNIQWNWRPANDDGSQGDTNLTREQAPYTGEHGKSNIIAPLNSLIGVFLDDNGLPVGNSHDTPDALDFGSREARDFATLAPELNQMFFVGDGLRDDGVHQKFVVPEGATRLFLGSMDGFEWNNNGGAFSTKVRNPAHVMLVG